jgi:hypothetical protein
LDFGHSFAHSTHYWVSSSMALFFCPCKQFFHIILLFQKKSDIYFSLHGLTHIYMASKCKSLNTLTLVRFYTIQNQFTQFYTYTNTKCK